MTGEELLSARPWLQLAQVLLLRTLPFAVYVVLARNRRIRAAWIWPALWLAFSAGLGVADLEALRALGIGVQCLSYYAALGTAAWLLAARPNRVDPSLLFAAAFVSFMLVPVWVSPSVVGIPVLVVGADCTLSCYSFVMECRRRATRPSLPEALFFLLVNPCLSYPDRGHQLPPGAPHGGVAWRAFSSMALMGLAQLWTVLFQLPVREVLPSHGYATVMLGGFGAFLDIYIHHTSLAGLQTSLMRMIGWHVPERYRAPLQATTPTDFWRRWNVYMGTWFRRYVFLPLAWRLERSDRTYPAGAVRTLAVLVTFAAIGLYHDLYAYTTRLSLLPQYLMFFLGVGVLTLLWTTARPQRLWSLALGSRRLGSAFSRLCMWHVISAGAWALQH